MSVTQDYKNASFGSARENCIVPVTGTVFVLKLVGKANALQLADDLHKAAKACHAKGAVDMAVLISDADLHTLAANSFFSTLLSLDLFANLGIEIRYIVADEQGGYYAVPHENSSYIEKYFLSVSEARRVSSIPLPFPVGNREIVRLLSTMYWFQDQSK